MAPEPHRIIEIDDRATGLRAAIVLDSVALGPAAGGVRCRAYPSWDDALADARRLARAMTIKCAVAGLDAGGGKAVVWDRGPDAWDRAAAFERLGRAVEELGGLFRTAGDLGTGAADLAAMARATRFVHTEEDALGRSVGRGLLACVAACAARRGLSPSQLSIAVQGAGAMGAACARALASRGARLLIADLDHARAAALAAELAAQPIEPDAALDAEVDLIAPCATGGVLTAAQVDRLRAWAICGAANNQVADAAAARALVARHIVHVPDTVASAGAVVDGIGRTVMGLADRVPRIDHLGRIAAEILEESAARALPADDVAEERAMRRIRAAAGHAIDSDP